MKRINTMGKCTQHASVICSLNHSKLFIPSRDVAKKTTLGRRLFAQFLLQFCFFLYSTLQNNINNDSHAGASRNVNKRSIFFCSFNVKVVDISQSTRSFVLCESKKKTTHRRNNNVAKQRSWNWGSFFKLRFFMLQYGSGQVAISLALE